MTNAQTSTVDLIDRAREIIADSELGTENWRGFVDGELADILDELQSRDTELCREQTGEVLPDQMENRRSSREPHSGIFPEQLKQRG